MSEVERLIKNRPKPFSYPSDDSRGQRRAYATKDVDDFLEKLEVVWNKHKRELFELKKILDCCNIAVYKADRLWYERVMDKITLILSELKMEEAEK